MDVTSITSAAAVAAAPSNTATTTAGPVDKLANEQTFLQLFVAQLQNQDPLNPADGTQFITQLAQFSSLEQLMAINQGISTITSSLTAAGTGSGNPTPPAPTTPPTVAAGGQ
jgi:flagellar basal-body rod modification protein FlgD